MCHALYAVRVEVYECMLAGKCHRNVHSSVVGGKYEIIIIIIKIFFRYVLFLTRVGPGGRV